MNFRDVEAALHRVHGPGESPQFQLAMLFRLYIHIARALLDRSNEVLKPFDLNRTSFQALMMLHSSADNSLNPSLVCQITGESRATMTRIADELVARGLIRRSPSAHDRRRLVLSIEPAGRRLVRKVLPLLFARANPAFAAFAPAELKQLRTLLEKQMNGLDATR